MNLKEMAEKILSGISDIEHRKREKLEQKERELEDLQEEVTNLNDDLALMGLIREFIFDLRGKLTD